MSRPARALLLVVVLSVLGCDDGDGSRPWPGDDDPVFLIPAGAEVTVSVGECLVGGPPLYVCPDWDVRSLTEASLSGDDFELGEQKVEAGAALLRVRSKGPGEGTLTVDYVDERGNSERVKIRLRALEVTQTQVSLYCGDGLYQPVLPVAAGSRFEFDIFASAGSTRLDVGDVSLVQAPGFTLSELVDGKGVAIAPAEPGTYTWTLAGGGTRQLRVYTPESLDLTLTEEEARGRSPRAIVLGASVGGSPVCVYDPGEKVVVAVTGDGCAPMLSGVEVAGPMPVRLASGEFKFELVGRGSCDVEARLAGGRGVTRPFTGTGLDDPPPVIGQLVSDGGVEVSQPVPAGKPCPASTSDGRCDAPWYLDGDCYIDSDWRIEHRDPGEADGGVMDAGSPVGVGLTTRLWLSLELGLIPSPIPISLGPPQNLSYQQDPAWDWNVFPPGPSAGLGLEARGCEGSKLLMLVTPLATGEHGLSLRADNLDDEGELDIEARKVDRVVYTLRPKEGLVRTGVPSVELFVRSEATLAARYQRQSGTMLHGTAPLRIGTDDPLARSNVANPDALATGTRPHTLTVSSPVASDTLTIKVRDAAAITGIGALEEMSVPQGGVKCMKPPVALGEGGVAILGRPPARPRVTLAGDSLVFSPEAFEDGLCLEGASPGDSTLQFSWGSASAGRVWTVVPAAPRP